MRSWVKAGAIGGIVALALLFSCADRTLDEPTAQRPTGTVVGTTSSSGASGLRFEAGDPFVAQAILEVSIFDISHRLYVDGGDAQPDVDTDADTPCQGSIVVGTLGPRLVSVTNAETLDGETAVIDCDVHRVTDAGFNVWASISLGATHVNFLGNLMTGGLDALALNIHGPPPLSDRAFGECRVTYPVDRPLARGRAWVELTCEPERSRHDGCGARAVLRLENCN